MKKSATTARALSIALSVVGLTLNIECAFVQFETQTDKKAATELIYREENPTSVVRCAAQCAEDPSCWTASYGESVHSCLLSTYNMTGTDNQTQLITETSWTTLSKNKCWAGWLLLGDICYFINEDTKNYTDAMTYCDVIGGKLAEPQTSTLSDLLRNYMAENLYGGGYWFGLNDIEIEDRFVWVSSGAVPSYTSWSAADPNEGRSANCAEYFIQSGYKWADRVCTTKRGAVCEMT